MHSCIFVLFIIYRIVLSSVYVAPSGQYNGHLLLLSAAVQPVYSLRWVNCFVPSEHASVFKICDLNL